jgi:carbohydrate-selective porin (OprB family)
MRRSGSTRDRPFGVTFWGALYVAPQQSISLQLLQAAGGLLYYGIIPGRDHDVAAVSVIAGVFSNRAPAHGTETVIEANYRIQLTRWLYLTPDLQYVIHPNGSTSPRRRRPCRRAERQLLAGGNGTRRIGRGPLAPVEDAMSARGARLESAPGCSAANSAASRGQPRSAYVMSCLGCARREGESLRAAGPARQALGHSGSAQSDPSSQPDRRRSSCAR